MKRYFSSKHLILGLLLRLLALGSFLPVVATERPTEVVPKVAIFGRRESERAKSQMSSVASAGAVGLPYYGIRKEFSEK